MTIYSTTNSQNEERIAIERVIRESNADQMARRRALDESEAAHRHAVVASRSECKLSFLRTV